MRIFLTCHQLIGFLKNLLLEVKYNILALVLSLLDIGILKKIF